MFRNFITLAYRHFVRSPLSSFIELFGMTAGLTVFLLVLLWVSNEVNYDRFNKKGDRIYRLIYEHSSGLTFTGQRNFLSSILQENMPEVENVARIQSTGPEQSNLLKQDSIGTRIAYRAGRRLFVDQSFFDIFSFEFIAGNPATALAEKNSIVITESLAKTIFGEGEAIGEVLRTGGLGLTVTGVVKDRSDFHIPFKMLISYYSLENVDGYLKNDDTSIDSWRYGCSAFYLLSSKNHSQGAMEEKIEQTIWDHSEGYRSRNPNGEKRFRLQHLSDIYFNLDRVVDTTFARHGDRNKLIVYSSIAIITLLLACINFINLNNAKYYERVKEVGIKKVCGAAKNEVFVQFLGEVYLLCFVSLLLALVFTHTIIPFFNELIYSSVSINQLFHYYSFVYLIIGFILIGLASGGFPAIHIASLQPAFAIKGKLGNDRKGFNLKQFGLIVQFSITIILLIGAMTTYRQVSYLRNKDLGFLQGEGKRIVFKLPNRSPETVALYKKRLLRNPYISSITHAGAKSIPGENRTMEDNKMTISCEGQDVEIVMVEVDEDYHETLGLEMKAGRFFEKGRATDLWSDGTGTLNVVFNETAVKTLGLEDPIDKIAHFTGAPSRVRNRKLRIIGVVKDFHLNSVDNPLEPMVLIPARNKFQMIAKISSDDLQSAMASIRNEFEQLSGNTNSIEFLDNLYERQYADDNNFATLTSYFTGLAILIACLGLLGVASHSIKLRIKEIGIRKTMGASSVQVLRLLTAPFTLIIFISAVVAIPVALLAMQRWLDTYPYHTDLPWWVFAVAFGLTIVVAGATILWQSWKASSMNPARLIRYE